ncbi:aminotransferase class V-fold PLP-dependent enzyme [candidate division KSB1 bacterium]
MKDALMKSIIELRKEFPALKDTCYMLNHSLGAMHINVYDALKEYADIWSKKHVRAWKDDWWDCMPAVGNVIARIINAPDNSVSLQPNVTTATACFISCFDFPENKNRVVYTDMEFPTIVYLLRSLLPEHAEHVKITSDDGTTVSTEKILEAIDDRTRLVTIAHVLYNSSYLQDVAPIIEKAHAHGAYVLLDVYQSAGVVPFDVRALHVDAVVGGSIKWLCGGPGTAYMYIRPDLAAGLEPRLTGWIAHRDPFEFAENMEYTPDLNYRFLSGTPHIPAFYAAKTGFEIIARRGLESIRAHSSKLTQRLIDHFREAGFIVRTPVDPKQRGGTVVVDMEQSKQISEKLVKRNILVDWRPRAGIRISPHFYNTADEVDYAAEEIKKLANR